MSSFYNKYLKIFITDLTIFSIFLPLYILFGLFQINFLGIMQLGFDFIILGFMGLIFGPFKGVFLCLISDLILQLIKGIGLWMWQYQLINIGVVLTSAFFVSIIKLNDKKWLFTNLFIAIFVFLSFYITIIVISIFPKYKRLNDATIISVIVISIIVFLLYIFMFIAYLKKQNPILKNIIVFFSLSSLLLILFSWITSPFAFIAYLGRMGNPIPYSDFLVFLIPRIVKSFFEIPLYTLSFYVLYDVLINKINYKNNLNNKWN